MSQESATERAKAKAMPQSQPRIQETVAISGTYLGVVSLFKQIGMNIVFGLAGTIAYFDASVFRKR